MASRRSSRRCARTPRGEGNSTYVACVGIHALEALVSIMQGICKSATPVSLRHALAWGCIARRICVLAGDISPIDVLTHIPIICEDHNIPYIYVPSKEVR